MILTSIVVLLLNVTCLILIQKNNRLKGPSKVPIINLLLGHLTQGAIVMPAYILKRGTSTSSTTAGPVCDVFRFSYMITNYLVCLSLLIITLDRMFAIKKPLLYRSFMTNRKMACAFIACWTYVVTLCSVPFIPSPDLKSKCAYNPQRAWTLAMLTLNTMLPFLVIIYCYCVIFKTARKSRKFRIASRARADTSENPRLLSRASEMRVAKVSLIVASAFVICWGPSFIYYYLVATCAMCFRPSYVNSDTEPIVTFIMKYLTFLNGIINPVIYCLNRNVMNRRTLKCRTHALRSRASHLASDFPSETARGAGLSPTTYEVASESGI